MYYGTDHSQAVPTSDVGGKELSLFPPGHTQTVLKDEQSLIGQGQGKGEVGTFSVEDTACTKLTPISGCLQGVARITA